MKCIRQTEKPEDCFYFKCQIDAVSSTFATFLFFSVSTTLPKMKFSPNLKYTADT